MHHDLYNSLDQKKTSYPPPRVLGLFRPRSIAPSPLQLDNDAAPVVLFHRHSTSQWPDISSVEHLHCQSSDHLHSTVAIDLHLTVRCDRPLTSFCLSAAFDHWPPSDCPLHSTIYHWPPRLFWFQLSVVRWKYHCSRCLVSSLCCIHCFPPVPWLCSPPESVFVLLFSTLFSIFFSDKKFFCGWASICKRSSRGGLLPLRVQSKKVGTVRNFRCILRQTRSNRSQSRKRTCTGCIGNCLSLPSPRSKLLCLARSMIFHTSLSVSLHPILLILYRTDATTQWHITTDTSKEW